MCRNDIGPHSRTEQLRSRGVSSPCIGEGNSLRDYTDTDLSEWSIFSIFSIRSDVLGR